MRCDAAADLFFPSPPSSLATTTKCLERLLPLCQYIYLFFSGKERVRPIYWNSILLKGLLSLSLSLLPHMTQKGVESFFSPSRFISLAPIRRPTQPPTQKRIQFSAGAEINHSTLSTIFFPPSPWPEEKKKPFSFPPPPPIHLLSLLPFCASQKEKTLVCVCEREGEGGGEKWPSISFFAREERGDRFKKRDT